MTKRTDVLVIGGGPAGLAAAITARKKGFNVTVSDGAASPIDKACGEGLMPEAVAALHELGVVLRPDETHPLRGVCFKDAQSSVAADFSTGTGLGIRRTVLHRRMVERAVECGVQLLWKSPVMSICKDGARIAADFYASEWIVGADGANSRARKWAGLNGIGSGDIRYARRQHFRVASWTDRMEIHWGKISQAYVTPLSAEESCVSVISRNPRARLEDAWQEFPEIASKLRDASPSSVERGAITVTRRLRRVYRGNVALVGDASGSVDAITAQGLCLSFQQASALSDALAAGNLELYQRAHEKFAVRPRQMEKLLLLLAYWPSLRKRIFKSFSSDPELFARLLSAHSGEGSTGTLAAASARLGWQALTT